MTLEQIDNLVLKGVQKRLADGDAQAKGYARNTVILTMAYAKSVMKAAYAIGAIKRDPTIGLKAPKIRDDDDRDKEVSPEEVPSRAEVLAILAAAPAPFRAAIALGATGLRIGEVMGITERQIRFDAGKLVVDQQLQCIKVAPGVWENRFTLPKRGKTRTIGLPQPIGFMLRRHLEEYPPLNDEHEGLLFRGGRRALLRRDAFYDSAWRPALVGAGLPRGRFVFHSLRHFAASSMLAEAAPITAVAAHLGDTVETVQRTYVHWLRDEVDVPTQILDRVLAPVVEDEDEDAASR